MRTLIIIGLLTTLLLIGCAQAPTEQDCYGVCDEMIAQTPAPTCKTINCPFDFSFDTDHYFKLQYVSGKPILNSIDASDCDELFEKEFNATKYLCKVQHAEILREAGRLEGKDAWVWQLDCACSYQT